ncbi:MAG TPA: zinc-binding dehydrogenase [Candidatus Limnocylindria bacterium]|nr:zinc-binding dehydrogenase [Candidatus Limnocylindria bacterium]
MTQTADATSTATSAAPDGTMRVGVMTGPGMIEIREVPIPRPGVNEVLVRIRATAICTWEQRSYSGQQDNKFPFIGGHEMAGEVAELGPGVSAEIAVGQAVTVGSAACGQCHWCRSGRDRACPQHYAGVAKYGDAWGPGGFAEYKVHPASGIYPIPGEASWAAISLAEPLSCAIHAVAQLDVRVADDAVVLGAGVMGLMNVVALKKHGARVIVSEIDPDRLAKARQLGADVTIDATAEDPVARVRELTQGRGAEHVIAAIGSGRANEQAMAMLSERGRFVLFASAHPMTPLEIEPNHMHNHETGVIGSLSSEQADFQVAARLIGLGQVDLSPLIQRSFPLAELRDALDASIAPGTYRMIVTP